jgi:hypothetical protein
MMGGPTPTAGTRVELTGRHPGRQADLAGTGKLCPARAARWKMRHQASWRFSQHAPIGMNTWRMRGWAASQVRVKKLEWLDSLSVITAISSTGLAASTAGQQLLVAGRVA